MHRIHHLQALPAKRGGICMLLLMLLFSFSWAVLHSSPSSSPPHTFKSLRAILGAEGTLPHTSNETFFFFLIIYNSTSGWIPIYSLLTQQKHVVWKEFNCQSQESDFRTDSV